MSLLIQKLLNKIKANPVYLYIFLYLIFLLLFSLLRGATADETYYIRETQVIAELLKSGKWIGDYGVGLHGFLFKLPVALLFIILGQASVFVATIFTIILSIASLFLFYKISKDFFIKDKYSFWATVLLSVTLYFINTSISYNRDIPALFTVLLFLYFFLKNFNVWYIGISLLLMLDAKEHVFLTIAPFYAVYIFVKQIRILHQEGIFVTIKKVLIKCFVVYILPFLWIIMMLTTSVIPVNMFIISILGLTETGQVWNKSQFSTEVASKNLMDESAKEIPKLSEISSFIVACTPGTINSVVEKQPVLQEDIEPNNSKICSEASDIFCKIITFGDTVLAYFGKFMYPRTFSFISIPKIIVLPALIHAVTLLINWFKKKDMRYIISLILLFNVIVVILRASHGRYLLSVAPMFMFFFIMFIRDGLKRPIYFRKVLVMTTIFVLLGLLFESTFLEYKIVLELVLLSLLWAIWFLREKGEKALNFVRTIFLIALTCGMFLTAIAFSFSIGQVSSFINFGKNRETKEILEHLDNSEKIWINDFGSGDLINVYRKNTYIEPEWHWGLANWLPKKKLLKIDSVSNTYTSEISSMDDFRENIKNNEIDKVVLIVSELKDERFTNQEQLPNLLLQDWLSNKRRLQFKNKVVYIFNVEK